jgi:hypothetical protein
MSHKIKGLGRNLCRNKKGSLSLGSHQAAKNSVFSVAHLLLNKSEYPDIVTVKLFDDSRKLFRFLRLFTEHTLLNRQ